MRSFFIFINALTSLWSSQGAGKAQLVKLKQPTFRINSFRSIWINLDLLFAKPKIIPGTRPSWIINEPSVSTKLIQVYAPFTLFTLVPRMCTTDNQFNCRNQHTINCVHKRLTYLYSSFDIQWGSHSFKERTWGMVLQVEPLWIQGQHNFAILLCVCSAIVPQC